MVNNAGAFAGGAGVIDDVLGQAYVVVKHVYDNLTALAAVAARTDAIDEIFANLELAETSILAQNVAIILAGVTNFRSTYAEGVADFDVGAYFTTAESGALRLYKRTVGGAGYTDMGDVVAPISRSLLGSAGGAALIGTSEEGIDVQEALTARAKLSELALVTGAALIGTALEGVNVQEALDARPTLEALAEPEASSLIGTEAPQGTTVESALGNMVPSDETSANLNSIISMVNTAGKFKGKFAWNTTILKMCMALGPDVDDGWITFDGETTFTPV